MPRLYAIPFTCSLAVHLTLEEAGAPFQIRWMRRFEHQLDDGASYDAINPKRRVPALGLSDGELLTELPAVMTFLDRATPRPEAERRRLLEWLCFLGTELHRPILAPLFDPKAPEATRQDVLERQLPFVLDHLADRLTAAPTLLGGEPSPADHYLFWGLVLLKNRFAERLQRPALLAFHDRIAARPATGRVLRLERETLRRLG